MKLIVVLVFTLVLGFLGWSLYRLVADPGKTKGMVHALTIRVVLSMLLFLFLYVAWYFGLVQPNTIPQ
jgi:hypothetical protein